MVACLAIGSDTYPAAPDPLHQFLARRWAVVGQLISYRAYTFCRSVLIEPEPGEAMPTRRDEVRSEEREQPPDVFRGDEVQGAAHAPRPHHRALLFARVRDVRSVQSKTAGPHRQRGGDRNLRLNAANFPDHLRYASHLVSFLRMEALRVAPQ